MKSWAAIFAIALLAGCARFKPEPISPDQTAADFEARSLTNETVRSFFETNHLASEWPRRAWDLDSLTWVAFYYQPALAEARATFASTRSTEVTAGERPNPSIELTPTYDTSSSPPWIPALLWDIPLETAGKRNKRIAAARFSSEAAKWNLVSAVWQARSHIRAALLNLYSAQLNESLLAQQELAQSNVVRLLEGQLSAGVISGFEVTQARVAAENAQLSRQDAVGQYQQARVQLAAALGLPTHALDNVQFDFSAFETLPLDLTAPAIRRQAVLNRADVRSALAAYASSQSTLQLEIAKQYPDVHLNPGYELDQTDNKWTLGLTVELPVLNQNQGGIAEAKAKRAEAAAHFLTVQAGAISDIDGALAAYDSALKKSATAKNLSTDLQRQLDSVRSQEKLGETDALAVANAESAYYTGLQNQLDASLKAQQALGDLEDAMQSPLTLSNASIRAAQDQFPATHK